MSKLRLGFLVVIFSLISFSPLVVGAANATFFGPIISPECHCDGTNGQPKSAPGWGCILQTVQNTMNLGISLSIIIATLIIAYAGFLWIMSPTNAENKQKGRTLLLNAVIGMAIVLSAWLVIDFFMKTLYDEGSFGPWNEILTGQTDTQYCLVAKSGDKNIINNANGTVTTCTPAVTASSGTSTGGGSWTFQSGISKQVSTESPELASLLSCMRTKLPAGVGVISSISDSAIVSGSKTFAQCAAGGFSAGCNHSTHACHFGGNPANGKVGQSYAVDFADEQNATLIRRAAAECNSDARYYFEGDRFHISLGHYVNAGCDMSMGLASAGLNLSTPATDSKGQVCTTTAVTTTTNNPTPGVEAIAKDLVASLVPTPSSLKAAGTSKLAWSSENAASCVGTGFSTNNATKGEVSVSVNTTTSYSLTCTATDKTTKTANATVSINTGWDPAAAAAFADNQADTTDSDDYKCAQYVRRAIAAGGLVAFDDNHSHPGNANEYSFGFLETQGFSRVSSGLVTVDLQNYAAKQGDVIVFQPICGDSNSTADVECRNTQTGSSPVPTAPNLAINHPHGHMAIFDGAQWVSLWKQQYPWSFGDYVQCSGGTCNPKTGTDYSRPGVQYAIFRHP